MAALTDTVVLLVEWEDISQGNAAVQVSHSAGVYIEWCVATDNTFADAVECGHRVYAPFLWEGSAAGQSLYMRTNQAAIDAADLVDADYPQIVVTLYP